MSFLCVRLEISQIGFLSLHFKKEEFWDYTKNISVAIN